VQNIYNAGACVNAREHSLALSISHMVRSFIFALLQISVYNWTAAPKKKCHTNCESGPMRYEISAHKKELSRPCMLEVIGVYVATRTRKFITMQKSKPEKLTHANP
jgi:hypothetical protein